MDIETELAEIKEVVKELKNNMTSTQGQEKDDRPLSPRQVLAKLGLKKDSYSWRIIRAILIADDGMGNITRGSMRIRTSQLEKFFG